MKKFDLTDLTKKTNCGIINANLNIRKGNNLMDNIKLVEIKQDVFKENNEMADEVRKITKSNNTKMINLMASPGAGKTSLLLKTIEALANDYKLGVIEGDIDGMVDSLKIDSMKVPVVQIKTGGSCHLDAPMIMPALESIEKENDLDLLFIENIGNLVCPAEFDIGADKRVMILSVPEGDDKVLKYPLMFSVSDVCIINKVDVKDYFDFDFEAFYKRVKRINPDIKVIEVSCKTGEGIDAWISWLKNNIL